MTEHRPSPRGSRSTSVRRDDGSLRAATAIAIGALSIFGVASFVGPAASARDAAAPSGAVVDDGAVSLRSASSAGTPAGTAVAATPAATSAGTLSKAAVPAASTRPVPATMTRKARNVPAYPRDGGKGRRIVYDKALMYVWIVNANNTVARRYPVTGRWDRPAKGTYRIYSKSVDSMNTHSEVTFKYMVRFAWGFKDESASIGFHSIPIYYAYHVDRDGETHAKGSRMTTRAQLGLPVATGGCVRQADEDALYLYRWSRVGDKVVVLPSP